MNLPYEYFYRYANDNEYLAVDVLLAEFRAYQAMQKLGKEIQEFLK